MLVGAISQELNTRVQLYPNLNTFSTPSVLQPSRQPISLCSTRSECPQTQRSVASVDDSGCSALAGAVKADECSSTSVVSGIWMRMDPGGLTEIELELPVLHGTMMALANEAEAKNPNRTVICRRVLLRSCHYRRIYCESHGIPDSLCRNPLTTAGISRMLNSKLGIDGGIK